MTAETKKGKVVVISGPSGVGKSTICRAVVKRLSDAYLSVSVTTRPKSAAEVDGKDYWFITKDEFASRVKNDLLLECAEVFGNFYGTPKEKVDQALNHGKTVILEIDVQGGKMIKAKCPDAVMIFILPPNNSELVKRISGRKRDTADIVKKRLDGAMAEIKAAENCYEYKIVNDDLEHTVNEVIHVIENCRR